jgi:hypothetical protein
MFILSDFDTKISHSLYLKGFTTIRGFLMVELYHRLYSDADYFITCVWLIDSVSGSWLLYSFLVMES